jgi:penicillin-binding protein 1A
MKFERLNVPNWPLPDLVAFNERVHVWVDPWWERAWVRRVTWAGAAMFALFAAVWIYFASGLPSSQSLLAYQPPLPTNVRGYDGTPVQTFARERRVELSYDEYPPLVIHAFISAEDKDFFTHHGIDVPGLFGAVLDYTKKSVTGGRARGGSTITQQVAKYLLRDSSYNVGRKIREAILAFRLESTLTKQQILELYLNSIFLGRNAYGVQASARAYFDKDVNELTLPEAAYLAVLPKAPANYDPVRATQKALDRRNYVLREMYRNGYIAEDQWKTAAATPLGTIRYGSNEKFRQQGGFFMEEVRRELIKQFGENAKDGANSLYAGGLWVRSSMDPVMQDAAAQALRDGLTRFDGGRGWRDTGLSVDVNKDWAGQLDRTPVGTGYIDWRKAVVLQKGDAQATVGFSNGSTGILSASDAAMPKRGVGGASVRLPLPWHGDHRQAGCRQQLRTALDPRSLRRNDCRGGPYRPSPSNAGRLRRSRIELQPGDSGAPSTRLSIQADHLCDGARKRVHAGDDRGRCALLRLAGRGSRPEMLRQLRPALFRVAHYALGC